MDILKNEATNIFIFTRWRMFGIIIFAAIFTICYIYNSYGINNLLKQNRNLEAKIDAIKLDNKILDYEIVKLQSADRIVQIAKDKLNLDLPAQPPELLQ
jgi:cell division protein FtsL